MNPFEMVTAARKAEPITFEEALEVLSVVASGHGQMPPRQALRIMKRLLERDDERTRVSHDFSHAIVSSRRPFPEPSFQTGAGGFVIANDMPAGGYLDMEPERDAAPGDEP